LQNAACGVQSASDGLIGPIFVEGIIRNQRYLQQEKNEATLVIKGARHVDIFLQQDGARPRTANVVLCSVAMSCQIGFQSASGVGGLATMFTGHETL
jgi:hypothetical protein